MINYIVKTSNYFYPMIKGMTEENLIQFLRLYLDKKSDFSQWINKNKSKINKIQNSNINKYLEKPLNKMHNLKKMIDNLINSEILKNKVEKIRLEETNKILIGGGNEEQLSNLLANLSLNYLFNKSLRSHILIDDLKDDKSNERLIYKIQIIKNSTNYNFYVKISPSEVKLSKNMIEDGINGSLIGRYLYEAKIYALLSKLKKRDKRIRSVEYNGHGVIKYSQLNKN